MYTPQTIVLIGTEGKGRLIAEGLASGTDRVVLCDADFTAVQVLAKKLQAHFPTSDIEAQECFYNAAWEADIIIIQLSCSQFWEAAEKIKAVANQKIVVTTTLNLGSLQEVLPNSKVVLAFADNTEDDFKKITEAKQTILCEVAGSDAEALSTIERLVRVIGFQPAVRLLTKEEVLSIEHLK